MSSSTADGLQGVADIPFDHNSRHVLAVCAGFAEQLPQFGEFGRLFRIRQLPRRNDLAHYVAANGYFHSAGINRQRANKFLDRG